MRARLTGEAEEGIELGTAMAVERAGERRTVSMRMAAPRGRRCDECGAVGAGARPPVKAKQRSRTATGRAWWKGEEARRQTESKSAAGQSPKTVYSGDGRVPRRRAVHRARERRLRGWPAPVKGADDDGVGKDLEDAKSPAGLGRPSAPRPRGRWARSPCRLVNIHAPLRSAAPFERRPPRRRGARAGKRPRSRCFRARTAAGRRRKTTASAMQA